jgi:DNA repair exonuclease SbcCD ATPase subunit
MRLLSCKVENFASYQSLEFDFQNIGLGLIHGATGSGKSTLQDIACWILYGITAKGGNVDEIRSWQAPDAPTIGIIDIGIKGGTIRVTRVRGTQHENDLYWQENESGEEKRGKDIAETQKFLEKRLGIDANLYLTGAYFSEFSSTASFFVATAKQRREILEKIANLELAVKLSSKLSEERKSAKQKYSEIGTNLVRAKANVDSAIKRTDDVVEYLNGWQVKKDKEIKELQAYFDHFEEQKQSKIGAIETKYKVYESENSKKVEDLLSKLEVLEQRLIEAEDDKPCPECGRSSAGPDLSELKDWRKHYLKELQQLKNSENPYKRQLDETKKSVNNYSELLQSAKAQVNPFEEKIVALSKEYEQAKNKLSALLEAERDHKHKFDSITQLNDIVDEFRGCLLKRSVKQIQDQTNDYLNNHFDGEFKIELQLEGDDKLNVNICKNGYDCVYKQLSKGQRGLLKLCFVVSIMDAAANQAGVHFSTVFLDEALDGLDPDLKVKAFGLLQELEKRHESVFVIEHSTEFKSLFDKQFHVILDGDSSKVLYE